MNICRIHVSQPAIRQNLKQQKAGGSGDEPVITVKRKDKNVYGHEVYIYDDRGNAVARVVQPKHQQLSCGARVWIECFTDVSVHKRTTDSEQEVKHL